MFVSPEPISDVNPEPPSTKFVVEAVTNDPYVVDEYANDCNAVQLFALAMLSITLPFEYERPLENVVVAPEYTRPVESTANPPAESAGNLNAALIVDDAVEKKPFWNPRVVPVAL